MKKLFFSLVFFTISILCLSQAEKNHNDSCYTVKEKDTTWQPKCVQIPPSFPGGDMELFNFLKKNINYPQLPKEMRIQGRNFVTFVIDTLGVITEVELYKGVILNEANIPEKKLQTSKLAAKQLDEESLRVIRLMPRWIPGEKNGKAVKIRYIMPLSYKLQ